MPGYKGPNKTCLQKLQECSTRGWVYRPEEGWIFAEMTPDELAEFRLYSRYPDPDPPIIRVRFPPSESWFFIGSKAPRSMAFWLAHCTMPQAHPLALTRFQIHQVIDEVINEAPLRSLPPGVRRRSPIEPGSYEAWLWADEIEICRELGCEITISKGYGWREWKIPVEWGPPQPTPDKEQSSIYALMDGLTQEVGYVGEAINPQQRYPNHLKEKHNPEKAAWIQSLQAQGRNPELIILEEAVAGSKKIYERERYWVDYYWNQGHNLTNRACRNRKRPN